MSHPEQFELVLEQSCDDPPPFSDAYQNELREFAKVAKASSQRAFAMDSAVGGGGPLGEFIFNHAEAILTALSTICGVWLNGRLGRKLRLKVGQTLLEATTTEELDAMVKHVKTLQKKSEKS